MQRFIFLLGLVAFAARADVRLPAIFSDHMVLQRGAVAPFWGWADSGETVTVQFAGQSKTTTTDKKGKWMVRLDAIKDATVKGVLSVKGKNTITIKDVLVGEVWVASGQSNMAMTGGRCKNVEEEVVAAKFPQIRMFITRWFVHLAPDIPVVYRSLAQREDPIVHGDINKLPLSGFIGM